jgi:hypothetical protein
LLAFQLAAQLSDLIGISNHMEEDFCWTILKNMENLGENTKRSLLSILEGNLKLSIGLSLLRECFLPLIDQRSSIDVLSQAIFSRGQKKPSLKIVCLHLQNPYHLPLLN